MLRNYTNPKTTKHLMSSKFYSWKRTVFIFYFSLFIVRVFSTTIDDKAAYKTILKFPKSVYAENNRLQKHSKVEGMYCFDDDYDETYEFFKLGVVNPNVLFKKQKTYDAEGPCIYLNEFNMYGNSLLGKSAKTNKWHVIEKKSEGEVHDLMNPRLIQGAFYYRVNKKLEDTSTLKNDLEQGDVVYFKKIEYERDDEKKGRFRVFGKTFLDHRYLIKTFEEGEDPEIKAVISFDESSQSASQKTKLKQKIAIHSTIKNLRDNLDVFETKRAADVNLQDTLDNLEKKSAADVKWYQYALIILIIILFILLGIILLLLSNSDEDEINSIIRPENEKSNADQESTPSFGHAVNHEKHYTPIYVQDEDSVNKRIEETHKKKETSTTSTETAELNTSSHLEVSTNESRNTENITEENIHSEVSSNENTHTEDCSQEHKSSEDSVKEQVEDTTQEKETSTTSNELTIETVEPNTESLLEVSTKKSTNTENTKEENTHTEVNANENTQTDEISQEHVRSETMKEEHTE